MDAFREGWLRRTPRQAVAVARALQAGRARARTAGAPTPVDAGALRDLLVGAGAEACVVEVPVSRPPWTATPLRVAAGDAVTWLASGRLALLPAVGLAFGPAEALHLRVGGAGPLSSSSRATGTFAAGRSGAVEIGSVFPGEERPDGTIAADRLPYRLMRGGFSVVVARWPARTDVGQALEAVAPRDASGLCAGEAARLAEAPAPPAGWHHHPLLHHGEAHQDCPEGIRSDVDRAVGIVRRPAAATVTESLRLRWTWRLEALPSALREDTLLTHDYLSVALEFDDGRDVTWHWSSHLPVGFAYTCPLDHWRHREYHVVCRTGTADLGRWVEEERPVLADHRVAARGPAPARIVRAWLIGVSLFQGGRGRGTFRSIELVDRGTVVAKIL